MVEKVIFTMTEYFGSDKRRINHALKVYALAKTIAAREGLTGELLKALEVAAVLHDIGIKESERKYNSSAGHYQELEGPPVARELLCDLSTDIGITPENLNRICYLIGHHHSYAKIDGLDFQALVEADFLVNIDEDNLDQPQIESISRKYFKTATGIALLRSMTGVG